MKSAIPPGLPRSPTGFKANQEVSDGVFDSVNLQRGSDQKTHGGKSIVEETEVTNQSERVVLGDRVTETDYTEENQEGKRRSESLTKGSGTGSGNSLWVEVAKEKKVLKKYELDIIDQEGEKTMEIPDDIINRANHLWDDYLIGKFLDTAPHIARVHAIVNKIWNLGDKSTQVEVDGVDETTMKFKVSNPVMRARILKRGMRNIGNIPLIVTKWTPNELKERP